MVWLPLAILVGALAAALISAGVFRTHDEWEWMRPVKACIKCEVPRSGLDLVPVVGDVVTAGRCRKCKAYIPWQYPVIELIIIGLVVFHFWRYVNGIWIPLDATDMVWLWLVRDITFTLFLVIMFVYDFKYSLILDRYAIPAAVVAVVVNVLLGVSVASIVLGILVLFTLFLVQHAMSGGRLIGSGDVSMAVLIGAMLGFTEGVIAVLLAYMVGAVFGLYLVLSGRRKLNDRVPFGTFLSVATFAMLVFGDSIISLL